MIGIPSRMSHSFWKCAGSKPVIALPLARGGRGVTKVDPIHIVKVLFSAEDRMTNVCKKKASNMPRKQEN